ncbi:hypothetical protein RFI_18195 [Reticulomyxa filosa]|uniref:Bulb-type lectin domain-containing protein n=1 Tax=Reticulomyxa filosa TaxID=46433 RepID=X6MZY3_RETFI|nr:hypothetical protein RFI_18195 [Reticulomyxa filosa]|eukprot:ETO19044.1 hypothetical protein RFI_18195 [Reticulomyxa filosa]
MNILWALVATTLVRAGNFTKKNEGLSLSCSGPTYLRTDLHNWQQYLNESEALISPNCQYRLSVETIKERSESYAVLRVGDIALWTSPMSKNPLQFKLTNAGNLQLIDKQANEVFWETPVVNNGRKPYVAAVNNFGDVIISDPKGPIWNLYKKKKKKRGGHVDGFQKKIDCEHHRNHLWSGEKLQMNEGIYSTNCQHVLQLSATGLELRHYEEIEQWTNDEFACDSCSLQLNDKGYLQIVNHLGNIVWSLSLGFSGECRGIFWEQRRKRRKRESISKKKKKKSTHQYKLIVRIN